MDKSRLNLKNAVVKTVDEKTLQITPKADAPEEQDLREIGEQQEQQAEKEISEIRKVLQNRTITRDAGVKSLPYSDIAISKVIVPGMIAKDAMAKKIKEFAFGLISFYDEMIVMEKNASLMLGDYYRKGVGVKTITFESSNTEFVSVDSEGWVSGRKRGGATITATTNIGEVACLDVYVVDKFIANTSIGLGIDVTTAEAFSAKALKKSPVFDIDLMNARNLWRKMEDTVTRIRTASGKTREEAVKEFNTRNTVSASMPFAFSARLDVNFKSNTSSIQTSGFTRSNVQVRTRNEYLNDVNPSRLKGYITDNFKKDLQSKDAVYMVNTYGTHVVVNCFYGGIIQLNFTTASSTLTSTKDLEIHVEAKAYGIGVKSTNEFKDMQKNFTEHSEFEIYVDGGALGSNNIDSFNTQYKKWEREIIDGYKNVMCGIDDYGEEYLIPLWKIAEQVNPAKANAIKTETDNRMSNCEAKLITKITPPPIVTALEVKNAIYRVYEGIKSPCTHIVLAKGTERINDKATVDAYLKATVDAYRNQKTCEINSSLTNYILDANKGGTLASPIQIFYAAKQTTNYKNDGAISDIVVCKSKSNVPSGYIVVSSNLNESAQIGEFKNSKYEYSPYGEDIRLACKKAISDSSWVIDFIGGFYFDNASVPALPPNDSFGKWEWVKMAGTSEIADLNKEGTKTTLNLVTKETKTTVQPHQGRYVRLIVHKTNISYYNTNNNSPQPSSGIRRLPPRTK